MFWIIITGIVSLGVIPLLALEGWAFWFIFSLFHVLTVNPEYWNFVVVGLAISILVGILKEIFKF